MPIININYINVLNDDELILVDVTYYANIAKRYVRTHAGAYSKLYNKICNIKNIGSKINKITDLVTTETDLMLPYQDGVYDIFAKQKYNNLLILTTICNVVTNSNINIILPLNRKDVQNIYYDPDHILTKINLDIIDNVCI